MAFGLAIFSIILFAAFPPIAAGSSAQKICAGVLVFSADELSFSDTEERMLCGDGKLESWSKIPPYQAKLFMQAFLQARGYLTPEFAVEEDVLAVKTGSKTRLREIVVSPQELVESSVAEEEIWRLYENKIVTPKLLSAMESDVKELLRRRAYACASFKALANGENGTVVLSGSGLERYKFGNIKREKLKGLHANAFQRFYPFDPEQAFDSSKLDLTEKRLAREGVAQGSYFLENCSESPQEFFLEHAVVAGPPRVLAFGLGVSSEVGGMLRARWANNRFGPMASQLDAVLRADFRRQSLKLEADSFLWPALPRTSLLSRFEVIREVQVDYEETQTRLGSRLKWSADTDERFWELSAGPALLTGRFSADQEGDADGNFTGMALTGGLESMSHAYELFDYLPKEGSKFVFDFDFRSPETGFEERLLKLEAEHTAVGRLWKWGRGAAVGAVRVGAFATDVDETVPLSQLPPSVKFYGGGSDDIRGFGYRQLPANNGLGALSKLLAKFELRKTHFFRPSLEVFAFYDAGYFGDESWQLSPRLKQSPGAGLRWVSPVGLFQTFLARGSTTSPHTEEGTVWFIGLGGEF